MSRVNEAWHVCTNLLTHGCDDWRKETIGGANACTFFKKQGKEFDSSWKDFLVDKKWVCITLIQNLNQ